MTLFGIEFIVTNILFSVILCAVLMKGNSLRIHNNLDLLLYSFGLGPVFTTLLLYYLLLFLPHRSNIFYLLIILAIYLFLAIISRRQFLVLWNDIVQTVRDGRAKFKTLKKVQKAEWTAFFLIIALFFILFLSFYLPITLQLPLDETDALKYGTLGKILYAEKSMAYKWIRTYPKTGFYQIISHAPSYSLFLTWEKIVDGFFKVEKDLYFKSVNAYYSFLILAAFLFWLSKRSRGLALVGALALFSGNSFFATFLQQNLDSFRVLLLGVSWIFLARAVEKKDTLSLELLGVFSGLAAFAHTIGAVLAAFNCLIFFLFVKGDWKFRFKTTGLVVFLAIIFGWFYYFLDIFWGYGWIIFKRTFTYWG